MNRNQLTFKNFLVVILPGALAFFGLEYLMYSLTGVSSGLTPVYDYFIIDPVLWIVLAFTAGLLVNGVSIVFGRLFQRMFFGQQTGTWLLSRNSRESGVLKNRLAHGAGHIFDRNFKKVFDEVFRNYFRYETSTSNLRDNLCYNALSEHSPQVVKRLDGLASSTRLRLNLGLTLVGFALAMAAVTLYTGGFSLFIIAQIGGCFVLGLGLLYSYLSQTAVYYHELYTAFFALAVEKDVQRQTVKAGRPDSGGGSNSSRGGRGRSRGRSRSGGGGSSNNRQSQSNQSSGGQSRNNQNRSSQNRRSGNRGGRPPHNRQSPGGGSSSSSSSSGSSQQSSQSDSSS